MSEVLNGQQVIDAKKKGALEFNEFEDTSNSFDHLRGDSDQVIVDAITHNTGKALVEKDLLTAGSYPLHNEKGAEVWLDRDYKGEVQIRIHVMPWRWKLYKQRLTDMKAKWDGVSGETKPWYHLEGFVTAIFLAKFDVHPYWDEAAFEKVLWREMPEAWISPEFAPKN